MEQVTVTATSAAPPEHVFGLVADSSSWPAWGGARRVEITEPGDDRGVGELRLMINGPLRVAERVDVVDPPHHLEYELLSGLPVRNYRATVDVRPIAGGSELRWGARFDNRVPGAGPLNRMIFRTVLGRIARRAAAAAEKIGDTHG